MEEDIKPAPIAKDTVPISSEPAKAVEPVPTESVSGANPKEQPKQNKRNSFFGSFFDRREVASPVKEKPEVEVAPAVPPKDPEVSTGAPVLPEPGAIADDKPTEPVAPRRARDHGDTGQGEAVVGAKGKFLWPIHASREAQGPGEFSHRTIPYRPREFIRSSLSQESMEDKKVEPEVLPAAEPAEAVVPSSTTASPPAPIVPVVPSTTTKAEGPVTETASPTTNKTTDPTKDKRRSSFFNPLGTRKEKKSDTATPKANTVTRMRSNDRAIPLLYLSSVGSSGCLVVVPGRCSIKVRRNPPQPRRYPIRSLPRHRHQLRSCPPKELPPAV